MFGQCFGGGRALEATARSYPNDTMDDIGGETGPPHGKFRTIVHFITVVKIILILIMHFMIVNPSTCIAWYPTRYNVNTLFGKERKRTDERDILKSAVMAIFAGEDTLSGATPDDAASLKECLQTDDRVNDHMIKVSFS